MPQVLLPLAGLSATLFGGGALLTVGLTTLWGFSTTLLGGAILSIGTGLGTPINGQIIARRK